MNRILHMTLLLGFANGGMLSAATLTDTEGKVDFNWSTMRATFVGDAVDKDTKAANGDGSLRDVEREAWRQGLAVAEESVRKVLADRTDGQHKPENMTEALTNATRSVSTTFVSNGRVRVLLEAPMGKLVRLDNVPFRTQTPVSLPTEGPSGIVLKLSKPATPTGLFTVVDETGKVLFQAQDVAKEVFVENMMGRWFKKSAAASEVGATPVTLDANPLSGGQIVVSSAEWRRVGAGADALLQNARVAVVTP